MTQYVRQPDFKENDACAEFGLNGLYVDGIIKERNISDLTGAIFASAPNLKVNNQIKKMAGIDSTTNSRPA